MAKKKTIKKKSPRKKAVAKTKPPSSKEFEAKIKELQDWRGDVLREIRAIIKKAAPAVIEELKWRGVPVWSLDGIITTGEVYKSVVKMTFAKGAFLKDPAKLFNSSLEGNLRRAIDVKEGEKVKAKALAALVREAIDLNQSKK